MKYFSLEGIREYESGIGESYEKDSPEAKWYLSTRDKFSELVKQLNLVIPEKLEVNYTEKPNKQAGQGIAPVLKEYILVGFIPKKYNYVGKDIFIKACLWGFKNGRAWFTIEVDVNIKNTENPFKNDRDMLLNDTSWKIPFDDETFPKDWDSLIAKIKPEVEEAIEYLDDYLKRKIYSLPNEIKIKMPGNLLQPLNQILYGPPGTGKTYHTINKAIAVANPSFDLNKPRKECKVEYERLVNEGQIVFTTFHQSMSYEDFIEGIKPLEPRVHDTYLKYDIEEGVFKIIADTAKKNYESSKKSKTGKPSFEDVFEQFVEEWEKNPAMKFPLKTKGYEYTITGFTKYSIGFRKASGGTSHTMSISTLKDLYLDKREAKPTGVGIYYPAVLDKLSEYKTTELESEELKNFVLIIDEINRGNVSQIFGELITLIEPDKRIGNSEALEIILPYSKEKFGVPPNLYIIGTMNTADRSVEALDTALRRRFSFVEMPPSPNLISPIDGIDVAAILDKINQRIEYLLDKDHQIGHSYFMDISNIDSLKEVFDNKIIPLLQEYFYGDYGKIRLVLGKDFVETIDLQAEALFGNLDNFDNIDISDRIMYRIRYARNMNDDFIKAINSIIK